MVRSIEDKMEDGLRKIYKITFTIIHLTNFAMVLLFCIIEPGIITHSNVAILSGINVCLYFILKNRKEILKISEVHEEGNTNTLDGDIPIRAQLKS